MILPKSSLTKSAKVKNCEKSTKMKEKSQYRAPAIVRTIHLRPSGALLSGSVVDHSTVTTMGQEVMDYDFSQDGFNHEWK